MGSHSRTKGVRRILDWLPDYDISDEGEVRRITPAKTRPKPPYRIHGSQDAKGYWRVKLSLPDGSKRGFAVHRLVCEAFHGPASSSILHAAHWDGNPENNKSSNVRWATPKENVGDDRRRHGRTPTGVKNPTAVLTERQVQDIRQRFTGKYGEVAVLAREYGMSHSGMWAVCHGEYWQHVS